MDNTDDIFEQAAQETLNDSSSGMEEIIVLPQPNKKPPVIDEIKDLSVINDKNINLPMSNSTPEKKKNWDELATAMKGRHAKRFNEVLDMLPPKEFVRVYLKALEFFKPKIVRQEGEVDKSVKQMLKIEINRGNKENI